MPEAALPCRDEATQIWGLGRFYEIANPIEGKPNTLYDVFIRIEDDQPLYRTRAWENSEDVTNGRGFELAMRLGEFVLDDDVLTAENWVYVGTYPTNADAALFVAPSWETLFNHNRG